MQQNAIMMVFYDFLKEWMQILLKLYTTSHCHLCESALELALQQLTSAQLELIDIAESEQLLTLYGTRIPVLQRLDTLAELGWPFSAHELNAFLNVENKKAS